MEAAVASVGKSVLNGLLSGAKAAIAEESALTQVAKRDMVFLADELEEMQSTLRDAEEENYRKVPRSRVRQLRSLAHDVEDCLQEYSVHWEKPSGWRLARTMLERHRIAAEMKGLRARVEDMNQRNLQYQLIHSAGFKPTTTTEQSNIAAAPIFGIYEARDTVKVDLNQLIDKEDKELRVIAIWGTSGFLGQMSIIRAAYENPYIQRKFSCRAWVRVTQPFNPKGFLQSLVKQFQSATGVDALLDGDKTWQELVHEFNGYVNEKSYLVVLNGLSTIEEWDEIKKSFPNNMKGSRIVVCTSEVEIASLCAGQDSVVSELKQLSAGHTIYAFYQKVMFISSEIIYNK